jgi:hypothetical protein
MKQHYHYDKTFQNLNGEAGKVPNEISALDTFLIAMTKYLMQTT